MTLAFSASPAATADSPAATTGSQILIAFDDLAAYRRALHVIARVFAELNDGSTVRLMPWRFDSLVEPDAFSSALREASAADLIVFSASDYHELDQTVIRWVHDSCAARGPAPGLLVALLGPPETQKESRSMLTEILRAAADAAGLAFLAPGGSDFPASEHAVPQFGTHAA